MHPPYIDKSFNCFLVFFMRLFLLSHVTCLDLNTSVFAIKFKTIFEVFQTHSHFTNGLSPLFDTRF